MDTAAPQNRTANVAARPGTEEGPRFVTGSTMRHIVEMTATAAVGLIAIFVVDFLSLLYISWLGDPSLTAGVGLGTLVLFLTTSINVGFMIAVGALVSRALGAGDRSRARRLATSACIHTGLAAILVTVLVLAFLPWLLTELRASEDVLPVARSFLWITMPSNVLMALAMGLSGVLRAVGDAKRAMYVTLIPAVVTVFLDPLLIFGFGLGTNGAAIAITISRVIFVYVGFHGAVRVHDLLDRPRIADLRAQAGVIYAIALPAVATNIATPIANAFFVRVLGQYGDEAIAATAIIDRLVPVAFGGLFALSGAVGPILGQNWGAGRFDRMRQALKDAVLFMGLYVAAAWLLLVLLRGPLTLAFNVQGLTADLVQFFCLISGFIWIFIGLLFVANASFNNLGSPLFSTGFNWARATLGVVPFAYLGALWGGAQGAIAGLGIGSIPFGIGAILTAFWTIERLERKAAGPTRPASNTGAER